MHSAVLIQYTRVTDRQTELAWHIRASIHAVARKNASRLAVFIFFGPGNRSTAATNVVDLVFGFLLTSDFQNTKTFPFLTRS